MPQKGPDFHVPVNGFSGVANSGNGVLELPRGPLYKEAGVFTTVAGALADPTTVISRSRLKMGAVVLRDFTPAQAINYYKLYGVTPVTGEMPIPFARRFLQFGPAGELNAWDTKGQPGKFTLESDFLNPGGGAVGIQSVDATVANGRMVRRGADGKPQPFLKVHKWRTETASASGATTISVTTLDHSLPIKALLIDASAGTITDLEVIADSIQQFKMSRTRWNALLARYKMDGTQFGFAYVLDYDGSDRSLACSSLEVKITCSAAANFTILNIQEAPAYV